MQERRRSGARQLRAGRPDAAGCRRRTWRSPAAWCSSRWSSCRSSSIVGRKLFAWPVPGDVEVLQMCAAFASSAFFAYCHIVDGDVKVDFFTHNLAPRKVALLDAFGSLLVGSFGALLAWRTAAGALAMQGGRRNVGRPRLAGVGRAGADGPGLRCCSRSPGSTCASHRLRAVEARDCDERHRGRLRHLRRHAGADGRARADRHRDVHRRLRRLPLPDRRQRRRAAQRR